MKVQKDIYEYSFIYYEHKFDDITLDSYTICLINNLASNINFEKSYFSFSTKNEYLEFISLINSDKFNMKVYYYYCDHIYKCKLTIDDKTFTSIIK